MIKTVKKTVICRIDGKKRDIYLRTLTHDGKQFIRSNGCENVSGHPKCYECLSDEFKIIEPSPSQDTQ